MLGPIVVLHVPHASTVVPDEVRSSFRLTDAELDDELLRMTDRYTDEFFHLPSEAAITVGFPVSRLVVDPERFVEDEKEPMVAQGMGVIYTRTSRGMPLRPGPSANERSDLLTRYYLPHHQRLTDTVSAILHDQGKCLFIDGHSFSSTPLPHEPDQAPERCDICVGTDGFHTPPWLVDVAIEAFSERGFQVELNQPFAGTLVPTAFFHREPKVFSVMVEVNRSLYMDERSGERLVEFENVAVLLREVLLKLVSAVVAGS